MRGLRLPKAGRRVVVAVAALAALALTVSALPASAVRQRAVRAPARASANAQDRYRAARQRASALVKQMTLDEKLQLVHGTGFVPNAGYAGHVAGIPRLGIPDLFLADGPNGVGNGATGVTAFPAAINAAATWDTSLEHSYGAALGQEQAGKGNNVALAPTINILRVPEW